MPRPSIKEQRTEEILQAYERCIAQYGVEGATLQKIAAEAGIARPLLRHHVGNSDDLLLSVVDRYIERSDLLMQAFYDSMPELTTGEQFMEYLFLKDPSDSVFNDVMISASLIYAAQNNDMIRTKMQRWFQDFKAGFQKFLAGIYPERTDEEVRSVSAGVIGIYFNVESMISLGDDQGFRQDSCEAAKRLVQLLDPLTES